MSHPDFINVILPSISVEKFIRTDAYFSRMRTESAIFSKILPYDRYVLRPGLACILI